MMLQQVVLQEQYHDHLVFLMLVRLPLQVVELLQQERAIAVVQYVQKRVPHVPDQIPVQQLHLVMVQAVLLQ